MDIFWKGYHSTELICPHCEQGVADEWDYGPWDDGEIEGFECPNCEKEFDIETEYELYFTTSKPKLKKEKL